MPARFARLVTWPAMPRIRVTGSATGRKLERALAWDDLVAPADGRQVVSENGAARILDAAGLPVAPGRLATTTDEAVRAAGAIGWPVAIKGISAAVTHRAAAGLVALDVDSPEAVARIDRTFRARAAASASRSTASGSSA